MSNGDRASVLQDEEFWRRMVVIVHKVKALHLAELCACSDGFLRVLHRDLSFWQLAQNLSREEVCDKFYVLYILPQ